MPGILLMSGASWLEFERNDHEKIVSIASGIADVGLPAVGLAGCNTVKPEGAGKDVQKVGEKVEGAAKK